MGVLIKRNICC